MINIFHIFVAVITFVLIFFRQKCPLSQLCSKSSRPKQNQRDGRRRSRDGVSSEKSSYMVLHPRYEWKSMNSKVMPKYKRDPQISVDNEDIDYQPLD